jgi:hypothetical protein
MQPIVVAGKMYIADQDGKVYCINVDDGSTLWTADNPGGTIASGAYAGGKVIFCSMTGQIRAYNALTGAPDWEVETGGPITSAPAANGTLACVGSHDGYVYFVTVANGAYFKSPYLGAKIAGGIAMDATSAYTGAENMMFYALNLSDGSIRRSKKVGGQSFYMEWPFVYNNLVYVFAAQVPRVGSEGVMETLMFDSSGTNITTERNYILRWYQGDTNGGKWADASPDWRWASVLRTSDFTEPFILANGSYEGCGIPPEPPVVDNTNRVLAYFKTAVPFLVKKNQQLFGTKYSIDISGVNQTTGERLPINNGKFSSDSCWFSWETDNLYGMSVGGNILYLHQDFRGTLCIDLTNTNTYKIYAQSLRRGAYNNICIPYTYGQDDMGGVDPAVYPSTTMRVAGGRASPVIYNSYVIIRTAWGVFCAEHSQ